jgi:hypothetical protein
MTITDQDPMLDPIFSEMEDSGMPWPTDVVKRHKNMASLQENWRRENAEFINNMAQDNNLWFHLFDLPVTADDESPGSYLLHDQIMQCIDVADDPDREGRAGNHKGWQVSDPFRGDHVLDAWYLAVWLVTSQQVHVPKQSFSINSSDPWAAQKAQFNDRLAKNERQELGVHAGSSGREPRTAQEAFRRLLKKNTGGTFLGGANRGPYNDA